jgi:integrase
VYKRQAQHNKRSWKDDRERYTLHLEPEIGHLPLAKISTLTIERLKNSLAHKRIRVGHPDERVMAPATVTQVLTLARKIINYASQTPMREDTPDLLMFVGRNPAKGIRVQRFDNVRYRILEPDDDQRIYEACAQEADLHDAILLSLATGMRRGEVAALRKEDCLHLVGGRIRVVDSKNGSSRTVFPNEPALAMLERRLSEFPDSPYVFPGRLGGHINEDHITRRFDTLMDLLEINQGVSDARGRIVFHSLRHTYGTRQIMAGMDVMSLKKIMGHRLLSTTERYVHLAEEHLHGQAVQAAQNSGKLVPFTNAGRK